MSTEPAKGMSAAGALRLEFFIIGLGLLALILIFQPFSITLYAIGGMLVIVAGLINNLLPLARPGVRVGAVFNAAMIVAMIFCIVLLVAIAAAHLYGVAFLNPPDPNTQSGKIQLNTPKFWMQPLVWWITGIAAALAVAITIRAKTSKA